MTGMDRAPQAAALGELKSYLRLDTADEDATLQGLLRTATATVEAFLGQLLVIRDLSETADANQCRIGLRGRPVVAIGSVSWMEGDEEVPLAPDRWRFERSPSGRGVVLLHDPPEGRVRVRYTAGLAQDWNGLAEPLRFAVVRAAAHGFAHRDRAEDAGLPAIVWQTLAPWRAVAL
ncbi:MAG: head-tail connector protein [Thermaurantiacus sp.]